MSLSRIDSMSEEEAIPMENVEFSMSLNDSEDHEEMSGNKSPMLHHHVWQQSDGSSIGSEDPMIDEQETTTSPSMAAVHHQYWQQWQQYYATYGYPHYPSGYPALQQQDAQYDNRIRREPADRMENPLPSYYVNPPQPGSYTTPQQRQPSQYSTWPANDKPAVAPHVQPNVQVHHKRSSSNPGISSGVTYNNERTSFPGIENGSGLGNESSLLQLSVTPKSSNYGAISNNRSPSKLVQHRSHQRSSSDLVVPSKSGASNTPRSGMAPLPRPADPMRSSKKRYDTSPSVSRHRRGSSAGGMSVSSMVSVVSDIRKSAFYNTKTEDKTGRVQLHFPCEAVHLLPSPRPGILYKMEIDNQVFENYHRLAEDTTFVYLDDNDDSLDDDLDNSRPEKFPILSKHQKLGKQLPPNSFVLTVPETIYRDILDEICAANRMPCGIFFCGHHEDVSRPSICIAVALIVLLLGAMVYAGFFVQV